MCTKSITIDKTFQLYDADIYGRTSNDSIDNITSLYRAVGKEELYSILKTRRFSMLPGGLEVKHFGVDYNEVCIFSEMDINTHLSAVLETKVLKSILTKINGIVFDIDAYVFKSGIVVITSDKLNEFNDALVDVIHRR